MTCPESQLTSWNLVEDWLTVKTNYIRDDHDHIASSVKDDLHRSIQLILLLGTEFEFLDSTFRPAERCVPCRDR